MLCTLIMQIQNRECVAAFTQLLHPPRYAHMCTNLHACIYTRVCTVRNSRILMPSATMETTVATAKKQIQGTINDALPDIITGIENLSTGKQHVRIEECGSKLQSTIERKKNLGRPMHQTWQTWPEAPKVTYRCGHTKPQTERIFQIHRFSADPAPNNYDS